MAGRFPTLLMSPLSTAMCCVSDASPAQTQNAQIPRWVPSLLHQRGWVSCRTAKARPVIPDAADAKLSIRCIFNLTYAGHVIANDVVAGREGDAKYGMATSCCLKVLWASDGKPGLQLSNPIAGFEGLIGAVLSVVQPHSYRLTIEALSARLTLRERPLGGA